MRKSVPWRGSLPHRAERRVDAVGAQRLFERLGLHHVGMELRAGHKRIDAAGEAVLVDMHDQFESEAPHGLVAERDHLAKLPGGVDVQQRERQPARVERLDGEVQHDARVFSDRVEHHRIAKLGRDLTHDLDRFRLQPFEVCGQRFCGAVRGRRS